MAYWVVIVDDDSIALRHAKNLLSEEGMRVSCMRSGRDLLKFMESNSPDLILLDILMPEMDGFECFHQMRQAEQEKGKTATPVIFVTGDNDSKNERRSLKYGASDFVHKPFDRDVLISRINNTIENYKTIEQLTENASVDKLTGFLNKSSGTKKIAQMCENCVGAMVLFDLDNFKLVNDIYGHDMGDQVLVAFSELMRLNTRAEDIISRIGGDEFLSFFRDITQRQDIRSLTRRLNEQLLNRCIELAGQDFDIPIGISAGVAFAPEHSSDYATLFRYADSAMYRAKQNGKHGVEVFDISTLAQIQEKVGSLDDEMEHITRIMAERGKADAAMVLGKDVFIYLYQFATRLLRKYKKNASKMLISLSAEGEVEDFSAMSACFLDIMQKNLRSNDIMVQLKADQFFALLPDITEAETQILRKNIFDAWEKTGRTNEVTLHCTIENMTYLE